MVLAAKKQLCPLVNDDPYPSQLFIASLAFHVATRRVVLVNAPSVEAYPSSLLTITPLDIP